jgi:hypothetical protein
MEKNKKMKTIILGSVIFISILFGFIQCNYTKYKMTEEEKVKLLEKLVQDSIHNFQDYRRWKIEREEGRNYYLVLYEKTEIMHEKFILFPSSNVMYVRFIANEKTLEREALLNAYPLQDCTQKFINYLGYSFNIDFIKSNIDFIIDNNIDKVLYYSEPSRIYFQKQDLIMVYLFSPNLEFTLFGFKKFNNHWYYK